MLYKCPMMTQICNYDLFCFIGIFEKIYKYSVRTSCLIEMEKYIQASKVFHLCLVYDGRSL